MPNWNLFPLSASWPEKLTSRLAGLATGLLVVALAYTSAKSAWAFWPAPPGPELPVAEPKLEAGTPAAAQNSAAEQVAAAHLFGQPDRRPPPPPIKTVKKPPPTRLNLSLKGVLAGGTPESGGAIIADAKGKDRYYAVGGEKLPGGAQLTEVLPDYVVLLRNGRTETLSLEIKVGGKGHGGRSPAGRSRGYGRAASPGSRTRVSGATSLRDVRDRVAADPGTLASLIRIREVTRGGKLRGFRVSPGKDRKLFKQLGFRPGDVVVSVNGSKLTNASVGLELLGNLGNAGSIDVEVLRRGRLTPLHIAFN
jgi:general secretion pathway protein C